MAELERLRGLLAEVEGMARGCADLVPLLPEDSAAKRALARSLTALSDRIEREAGIEC
jgi:hypothetical protein